ncbi:hypothetical protein B1987_27530 [Mycobacterium kansasii]|nr:hypothetical protein B1987_27530 [Mycobacterium kansasii]
MNTTIPGLPSAVTTAVRWPASRAGQSHGPRDVQWTGTGGTRRNRYGQHFEPGSPGSLHMSTTRQVPWTTFGSPVHRNLLTDWEEEWSE